MVRKLFKALRTGEPGKAIAAPAVAAPYEIVSYYESLSYLPVRETYLAMHQGAAAAAEFQTILNHPGVVLNRPIGPLAYLGLARSYVLDGDGAKARTAYQDFFAVRKHADPDISILNRVRAEYAKLQ